MTERNNLTNGAAPSPSAEAGTALPGSQAEWASDSAHSAATESSSVSPDVTAGYIQVGDPQTGYRLTRGGWEAGPAAPNDVRWLVDHLNGRTSADAEEARRIVRRVNALEVLRAHVAIAVPGMACVCACGFGLGDDLDEAAEDHLLHLAKELVR